jgi:hypothetical protein
MPKQPPAGVKNAQAAPKKMSPALFCAGDRDVLSCLLFIND